MESVDDLVIVVDDILPFLANVYLYKKGMTQTRMSEQHVNVLLSTKGKETWKVTQLHHGKLLVQWDSHAPQKMELQ